MIEIKVSFFATLRERSGVREKLYYVGEGSRIQDLKKVIIDMYPTIKDLMDHVVIARNHQFAFDGDELEDQDEIAIFPPVSGGVGEEFPTFFKVTENEIDLDDVVAKISLPSSGAVCIFTGLVRAITHREGYRETQYLEYEAYISMAEIKMRQVADEMREKWPELQGVAIIQRIGRLVPGSPTVIIACSAAHRDTGIFDAARFGIDRLKEIVPVWKKEVGPSGDFWVVGKYIPGQDD
jgi:MoaE-MoaD fusion protein